MQKSTQSIDYTEQRGFDGLVERVETKWITKEPIGSLDVWQKKFIWLNVENDWPDKLMTE